MTEAAAVVRKTAFAAADHVRTAIVLACAGALILADAFVPLSL